MEVRLSYQVMRRIRWNRSESPLIESSVLSGKQETGEEISEAGTELRMRMLGAN